MLGADISFLPQLEDRDIKFSENGVQKDPILIMKDYGFNSVRLRIFKILPGTVAIRRAG